MIKRFLVSLLLCLTLTFSATVGFASTDLDQNKTEKNLLTNNEIKPRINENFTETAKLEVKLIYKLIQHGSIIVKDGKYIMVNQNDIKKYLSKDEFVTLEKYINIFNEGISLGIFEIDANNIIQESNNFEKVTTKIRPYAVIFDLDSEMKTNGNTLLRNLYINISVYGNNIGYVKTGKFFASKVKTGGDWDYKSFLGVNTTYQVTVDNRNIFMSGEQIGNAHYGYVGRKVFSADLLKTAAGAYQIYSGTSHIGWYNSYFDDPNDQYWIQRGINYCEGGSF